VIFLTGASGYVGTHLLRRLIAKGERVRALVLPSDPAEALRSEPVEIVSGDVTDLASFEAQGAGIAAIVHAAALMLPNAPDRIHRVNVLGTAALLRFAAAWDIRRFVYLSAVSAVYPEKNSYGRSKAEAERLVSSSGLDYTILRPTMIYGVDGGLHFQKLVRLVRRVPFVFPMVGSGRARLQPVYIDDVVTAIETVLAGPRSIGKTYNVSGATVVRFEELADLILAETRLRRFKLRVPAGLCTALARLVAVVSPVSFLSPEAVHGLLQDAALDYGEFQRDCGYSPLPLDVGLKRALSPRLP
jgi:nucleoside-diphosphate-sugar epimerase